MVADEYMEDWITSTAIGSRGVSHSPKMIHSRSVTSTRTIITTRRNPSFSSALLEAISKSTEDEAMKPVQAQDLKIISTSKAQWAENTKDPHLRIPNRSGEIGIFEAERYFSGHENGRSRCRTCHGEGNRVTDSAKHRDGHFSFRSGASDTCSEGSINGANTPYWPFSSSEVESERLNRYRDVVLGSSAHKRSSSRNSHGSDYQAKESTRVHRSISAQRDAVLAHQRSVNGTKESKDAKKPKQPVSPGSKLASFLNSLFIPTGTRKKKKKAKHSDQATKNGGDEVEDGSAPGSRGKIRKEGPCSYPRSSSTDSGVQTPSSARTNASTPSSNSSQLNEVYKGENAVKGSYHHHDSSADAASYHPRPQHRHSNLKSSFVSSGNRSTKNESNGVRRSVTFYPTSVILDENARPCGEKHLSRADNPNDCSLPLLSKKLRLQLLDKGGIPSQCIIHHLDSHGKDPHRPKDSHGDEEEDDDDDDAGSDSSSDLFDLENFDSMDMGVYSRDLPVYETTHLETNKAIANGLL